MYGERFLFSFGEAVASGHRTHGEAQIPSCGSLKGDFLNCRAAWPLVGLVTWSLMLLVVQKLEAVGSTHRDCSVERHQEGSLH